ncbi:MAG: hypothetical protein GFH27_549283n347 [Chloroflexi bacterium AL-W]|nr:hypothetical protein [Chloroflexi bacterium AL-N1]NOK64531.1 hypothetical protein [Chloroflexi bacterium AL-N10]NOK75773.1 hypothetical protein [Chloroflexi bacterium AL-N5]NOK80468.1 hypothetical protein [Chloroflexi bacterium AL-W]NOK86982.1 hypothetical protein [Chloroflexi bacterium AL-N15]
MQSFKLYGLTILFIAICGVWIILISTQQPDDGLWADFYAIYRGGQALFHGENPYGAEVTAELIRDWDVAFADAGIAYPLPAVVGVLPLLLLPLPIAAILWIAFGTAGSFAAIRLRDDWQTLIFLPLCFMPLHRAIMMKQATLVWFALVIILLFAMRGQRAWLVGLCIVLLPAKPQVGLLFALAGGIWAIREHRNTIPWICGWGALIWGGSFLFQPNWIQEWLISLQRYDDVVYTASLLPWGLILLAATWRLPWYAQLGAAQVVLFPLPDVYGGLPLLLVWVAIGGPLAIIGSSISWLGVIANLPNNIIVLGASVIAPLIICSAFYSFDSWRSRRIAVEGQAS